MKISLRVSPMYWLDPERCRRFAEEIAPYAEMLNELALFTAYTHPPQPLDVIRRRAGRLQEVMPELRQLGMPVGINHLATVGHLDENLAASLSEPWQRMVDVEGRAAGGSFCITDPRMQDYVRQCYVLLAQAGPDFIWVDDDVRLEGHMPLTSACFCDLCLAEFSAANGKSWDRPALVQAFAEGDAALPLRRAWLEHNRNSVDRICRLAREAVDTVNPNLPLGLMTGEIGYSGHGYQQWLDTLSRHGELPLKFRPGGGFYQDRIPQDMIGKMHGVGRQVSFLPPGVGDIQWEHENFPYHVLGKSRTMFTGEIAGALGVGCNGVALNLMGTTPDPIAEYLPYFDAVASGRDFYDQVSATVAGSVPEGIWRAFTRDHHAVTHLDGGWPGDRPWSTIGPETSELYELGLPAAYAPAGTTITLLYGDAPCEFSPDELQAMFHGGVLLDGLALRRLHQMGLGHLTGFVVESERVPDVLEVLTSEPLNGIYGGYSRDCRPSFWPNPSFTLTPLDGSIRPLSRLVDLTGADAGLASGIFENELGGRVAVFGYYPFKMLGNLAKSNQMKAVCRWLSHGTLAAYVASFHRGELWVRRTSLGEPVVILCNTSLDPAIDLILALRCEGEYRLLRRTGEEELLSAITFDGGYARFTLPVLAPWEWVMIAPVV